MKSGYLLLFAAVLGVAPLASGAVLFSDNFDSTPSSSYNVNATSGDHVVQFGYDYSADSIPAAPHQSGSSTIGLKLDANETSGSQQAVTLSPKGQSFSSAGGGYRLTFDAWQNSNGPFPGGGAGSTEFLQGGIGYDNATVNSSGVSGSGTWVTASSDGDALADYRIHDNNGTVIAGDSGAYPALTNDGGDPYYATEFPGAAPPAGQTSAEPNQTGNVRAGAPAFVWVQWQVDVVGKSVTWSMDDPTQGTGPLVIATLTNAAQTDGNISIGYEDIFASIADNQKYSFGIIDNLKVESLSVPEPASLGLLGLAGLGLLKRRRQA